MPMEEDHETCAGGSGETAEWTPTAGNGDPGLESDSSSSSSSPPGTVAPCDDDTMGERESQDSGDTERKRKSHVKTYVLPPCKVCGAPGTGFHYGVNTCEACKGFFRRGLSQNGGLVCRQSGRCRLDVAGKRNMCPKCRWQKCLEVGMSVGGIKTGRYTAEKHTHNTLEVKRMEAKKAATKHQQEEVMRHRFFEQLLAQLLETFDSTLDCDNKNSDVQEHLQTYVVSRNEETVGNKPVSYEEFADILSQTGVQVDNRIEMWKSWLQGVNTAIKRAAKFAKAIPGFRDLLLEDQAILLKKSLNENWLICRHMTFDLDRKLFVEAPGRVFEVDKMFAEDHAHEVLKAVRKLQQLKLSTEERALLAAFAVVSPDRAGLSAPHQVAALQDQLLDAILWLTRKLHHDNDAIFFARIVSALTELRNLDAQPEKENAESLFKVLLCGNVEVPPIVYELADVTPSKQVPPPTDDVETDASTVKLKDTLAASV